MGLFSASSAEIERKGARMQGRKEEMTSRSMDPLLISAVAAPCLDFLLCSAFAPK
jgi:hypothetical protein